MTTAEEFITDLIDILDDGVALVDELVMELTKSNDEDDNYDFDEEEAYDDDTEEDASPETSLEEEETVQDYVEETWLRHVSEEV